MKKAVILLNMGGPNNLNDVEVFLKNMFNDPYILGIKFKPLRRFVAWLITFLRKKGSREIYKALGGKSPITDHTASLCKKVTEISGVECDFVMRYVSPFADEVLPKYKEFDEIVLLPLYPHHSSTTVMSSVDDAKDAIKRMGFKGEVRQIPVFYESREYNEILLGLIKEKISNLSSSEISEISLILSAHSLPKSVITKGDLYKDHLEKHKEIISNLLYENGIKFGEILLTYQSKLGPVEWLKPFTDETLKNLESKKALLVPIAFCIDNSETDYELDMEYRDLVEPLGYEYYDVCKCPNDRDEFARFIADISR